MLLGIASMTAAVDHPLLPPPVPSDSVDVDSVGSESGDAERSALFLADGSIVTGRVVAEDSVSVTMLLEQGDQRRYERREIAHLSRSAKTVVTTTEGAILYGQIIERDERRLLLGIEEDEEPLAIPNEQVFALHPTDEYRPRRSSRTQRDSTRQGRISQEPLPEKAHDLRQIFAQNGIGMKKGEGYYQNVWVLGNMATVGVADNFAVTVGAVPLFFLDDTPTPLWVGAKLTVPGTAEDVNLSVGGTLLMVAGEHDPFYGTGYAIMTLGSRRNHANIGVAILSNFDGFLPIITAGFAARLGKRWGIVSENYLALPTLSVQTGILSAGFRYFSTNSVVDFGVVLPTVDLLDILVILPWLSVTVPL